MKHPEWRLWMKVRDAGVLAQYMAYRGFTVRSLAEKVRVSHATIGHLRSGTRKAVKPPLAKAIAKALDAPEDLLFVPELSRVSQDGRRKAVA